MFLVDKLAKPLSSRINLNALTGTFSQGLQAFTENVAQKDKILTALDHSTNNIVAGGTAPILTNVNTLSFDGAGDRVQVNSVNGISLLTDADNHFGSCTITTSFMQTSAGTQVIHSCGAASYRLFTQNGKFKLNATSTEIFDVELNKLYKSTITFDATGAATKFVLENVTDGSTETYNTTVPAGGHNGASHLQIGARSNGLVFVGVITDFSITNSSVGADMHLPMQEGSGSVAYDISGNGANGTIVGATWTTVQGGVSHNNKHGHDLVGVLNGTVSGFDTGIGGDELDMYEIKMQSTSDVGGDGNSYFVEASHTNPTLFMTNSVEGSGRRMSFRIPTDTSVANGIVSLSGVSSADFNVYKVDYTNTSAVKVFVNGELVLTDSRTVVPTNAHFHIGNDNSTNASDNGFFYHFKGWKDGVLKIHAVVNSTGRVKDLISGNLLSADVGGIGSLGVRRFPALINKTKQVATFNGVNDEVSFGTHAIPATESVEVVFTPENDGGRGCLYSQGSLAGSYGFALCTSYNNTNADNTNCINFRTKGTGGSAVTKSMNTTQNTMPADGTTYKVTMDYNSSAGTISISLFNNTTGALIETISDSITANHVAVGVSRPVKIGEDQGNLDDYQGTIHSVKSSFIDVDFSTNSGDIGRTTITDNSGNGNNGTVSTSSTALFWGRRVVDSSGSLVSAHYANSNFTFNNTSGFVHNNSEVSLIINTTGSNGVTKSKSQLDSHSNGTDKLYVSKTGTNIKRLVQYDTANTTLTTTEQANNERFFS